MNGVFTHPGENMKTKLKKILSKSCDESVQFSRAAQIKSVSAHSTHQERPCNLCGSKFLAASLFSRFCEFCKAENDVYQSAEWLPAAEVAA
jgi:hypothetical protein